MGEFYQCKCDWHGPLLRVRRQLYRRVRVRVRQTFMAYLDHINCAHLRSLILKSKIITLHRLFTVQEAFLAIEYSILRVGAVEIFNKDYETYVSVLRPVKQLQITEKRKCVNKLITLAHDEPYN